MDVKSLEMLHGAKKFTVCGMFLKHLCISAINDLGVQTQVLDARKKCVHVCMQLQEPRMSGTQLDSPLSVNWALGLKVKVREEGC